MKMMKTKLAIMTLLLAGSAWLSGCEQEGPAEQAGENIDEATEEAGERMEESGERMQERVD
ncbi:hypothetical protein [Nitrosococcus wardiae]|uniref:YtxH domain-containing protein n=1 Tax=Nitrosococcus wardiae TaxID=1814290 RepID=A0A4P7C4D4_9GAMM|nr:hypothetical protein [Nitrosococcus wardiae]QBQ55712.1 hypothetical protein E3U44_15240 [Nitrosococcus wardiae]